MLRTCRCTLNSGLLSAIEEATLKLVRVLQWVSQERHSPDHIWARKRTFSKTKEWIPTSKTFIPKELGVPLQVPVCPNLVTHAEGAGLSWLNACNVKRRESPKCCTKPNTRWGGGGLSSAPSILTLPTEVSHGGPPWLNPVGGTKRSGVWPGWSWAEAASTLESAVFCRCAPFGAFKSFMFPPSGQPQATWSHFAAWCLSWVCRLQSLVLT